MKLLFVHGWSVTNTDTYGELPEALSAASHNSGLNLDINHLYLGRYISFHDEVSLDDIAKAMDKALRDLPWNSATHIEEFSCITHSTGGPVVRNWVDTFYSADNLASCPLKHLVMLAPANHGSALAKLGKERLGRIKAWWKGIEPGQRVLDWLSLGSSGQWELNRNFLNYKCAANNFYPFVLTGQGIDNKFYDFINTYLVEEGSDGVVRVAGANMNSQFICLKMDKSIMVRKKPLTFGLVASEGIKSPNFTPIRVYEEYSHSGKKMGIMRSIRSDGYDTPVVKDILTCLHVDSASDFKKVCNEFSELTSAVQAQAKNIKNDENKNIGRYVMLVFCVKDSKGNPIKAGNYDLLLLAGKSYRPNILPPGFFLDKQMNEKSNCLIYYLDADKMKQLENKKFGVRVIARPQSGFSYYVAGEFRSNGLIPEKIFSKNKTTYIEIILDRFVDEEVFRFDPAAEKRQNFKRVKPSGNIL